MAYIVPTDIPKSCRDCFFYLPNSRYCNLLHDTVIELNDNLEIKAQECPLEEIHEIG